MLTDRERIEDLTDELETRNYAICCLKSMLFISLGVLVCALGTMVYFYFHIKELTCY